VNGVEEELQFLSGGEKLRVGIALRLAISKLVVSETQSGTIKNLFIDEGDFGALDENGLNDIAMLFEKLKNNFNKIILITHIKELKDRIADYAYNVIKNGNYSSKVEVFNE
jgi:exonuclease SbcC